MFVNLFKLFYKISRLCLKWNTEKGLIIKKYKENDKNRVKWLIFIDFLIFGNWNS